mmetsp:Transcript_84451/g.185313  ORF Transcript_84451/g.185313 Transcript_84451/m.185313 type:complete len:239 (-) Transcript_84451:531-1247(-)
MLHSDPLDCCEPPRPGPLDRCQLPQRSFEGEPWSTPSHPSSLAGCHLQHHHREPRLLANALSKWCDANTALSLSLRGTSESFRAGCRKLEIPESAGGVRNSGLAGRHQIQVAILAGRLGGLRGHAQVRRRLRRCLLPHRRVPARLSGADQVLAVRARAAVRSPDARYFEGGAGEADRTWNVRRDGLPRIRWLRGDVHNRSRGRSPSSPPRTQHDRHPRDAGRQWPRGWNGHPHAHVRS